MKIFKMNHQSEIVKWICKIEFAECSFKIFKMIFQNDSSNSNFKRIVGMIFQIQIFQISQISKGFGGFGEMKFQNDFVK